MSESEWDAWDKQIEADVKAGRLDKLLKKLQDDVNLGLTLPICEGKRRFHQTHSSTKQK